MTGCCVQVWGGATCTVYAGFGQGQTLGLVAHVYCAECEDTVNLHKKVINLSIMSLHILLLHVHCTLYICSQLNNHS